MQANSFLPPDLEVASDPLLDATAELEHGARVLDLEDWVLLRLKQFEQETTLHTIFRSAGVSPAEASAAQTIAHPLTALWVQHSTARGATIVPLAISGNVFLNSVRAKAMRTTWTSALYGLDAGGGAAAIILDPRQHSEPELREAIQGMGQAMAALGGSRMSVGAPHLTLGAPHLPQSADVGLSTVVIPDGLNPVEMEWLNACFRAAGNMHTRISGKLSSNEERGTLFADDSIAYGLMELIRCASGKIRGLRVAIQGFDLACQCLVRRLHRNGARIVAVADASGGLRHPLGLDPAALVSYAHANDMLLGYPEAEAVVNADVLETDCEVLVLAAAERQIGPANAGRIAARVILESIPQAITAPAKPELSGAGKIVISDLLCGGIALLHYCSEIERTNLAAHSDALMRRQVRKTWTELKASATRWELPMHRAAEILAIERVAEVIRARGF